MSFDFNYKFWVGTKKDIDSLVKRQNILKKLDPLDDPIMTYKIFSEMYVLYAELAEKLSYIYQKTFQVQKRKIVRELVEAANARLLELKAELKNLELSEYIYTDKALIARKMTPNDLVIWRSPGFLYRRPPDIQNILYDKALIPPEDEEESQAAIKEAAQLGDAVILIQAHERARQARVYYSAIRYDIKYLKKPETKKTSYKFDHKADQPMSIPVKKTVFNPNYVKKSDSCCYLNEMDKVDEDVDEEQLAQMEALRDYAARLIQRTWRAYKSRKQLKARYVMKETLFGIVKKRRPKRPDKVKNSIMQMYKEEMLKTKLDDDFVKLVMDERTRLLQQRSPWIMEDISDHIRGWFREFYDKLGAFHPYPEAVKSGTILVVIDETFTIDEYKEKMDQAGLSKEEKKKLAEKAKAQKQKERAKIRKEKMKEAKRRKKMKDAGIIDLSYDLTTNKNIQIIEKNIKQYSVDWKLVDEYLNKNHEPIKEWITETEMSIIHKELRGLVDEFMRVEYELLQNAWCLDNKKKYKPPKKKKEKKPKNKKAKKIKDMTADRTLESLYNELYEAGIIEKHQNSTFDDYVGEFNFVADDTRDEDRLTTLNPSKGDIKMAIEECIMGMGEFTLDKPKSLCLIGPLKSGKKMLCKIIASELDAVFMNLSPERTVNYVADMNYFVHIVTKVAKAFQPTIIYIQDCHRVFWKKVPPEAAEVNPKALENVLLPKILKPIKKQDKVMLLGTSDQPWMAKPKMKKAFQKFLLLPGSDYGSSFLVWLEMLTRYAGEETLDDYAISTLAKVLQQYQSGEVVDNMESTLDITRRMLLKRTPLIPDDFLEYYLNRPEPIFPVDEKIMAKYQKYFSSSNKMSKLRRAFFKKKNAKDKKKK